MKVLFLIPPSEWKNDLNNYSEEKLSFDFEKPIEIATFASEKDLKCKWNRYIEWIELNERLKKISLWNQRDCLKNEGDEFWFSIDVIHRYNWEMYKAIDYKNMSSNAMNFFDQHFLILSWMYWILKPLDKIGNYKLPIETKWLYQFWWDIIPNALKNLKPDFIVNLLPISYAKLIWVYTNCNRHKKKKLSIIDSGIKIVNVNFYKSDWKKISHWVKKLKWEWIKNICEKWIMYYKDFWWEVIENWNEIEIKIVV